MEKFILKVCINIILVVAILFLIMIYTVNIPSNGKKYQEVNIPDADLSKIQNNIEHVLNSQYEIMKDWKYQSCENIISDLQLLKLVNDTNQFKSQWYEKVGLKISNYNSTLNINSIEKVADNIFLIDTTFDVEFFLSGRNTPSKSSGEKYQFEVKKENNEWYITKMLNNADGSLRELRPNYKAKYRAIIESKIKSLNNVSNDMDKYLREYNDTP